MSTEPKTEIIVPVKRVRPPQLAALCCIRLEFRRSPLHNSLVEEVREESLLRLAGVLDSIGLDERLLIRDHYMERAFGGTNAVAIAKAKLFAEAHGCSFTYNRVKRQGSFTRAYPAGGRA